WLVRNLRSRGFNAIYTTEPSKGEVGSFIRQYVLQRKRRVPAVVEALLFAVDRVDHVESKIEPALESGKIVVSDRYVYSSLAYQGAAGLNIGWIKQINSVALPPDLAIYIDAPPEVVLKRMRRRRSVMETLENQSRVREVYMQLVREERLVLVDGNRPASEVAQNILAMVLKRLKSV
ncbi:dTMP kinase, partial [Candidatus Bathyarchaeota archaeon]|nr:dTMP kinase [Candidatus Bathyarchaeota archaeon]